MRLPAMCAALVCITPITMGHAAGDQYHPRQRLVLLPALLVKGLPRTQPAAAATMTFDTPSESEGAAPPRNPVRDLGVSLNGSKAWTHYSYQDSPSEDREAYERSLKDKREAWEDAAVRTLVGHLLPASLRYDNHFSATSKGLKYSFSNGWTAQMGFKPSLEVRYRFK